ncbi:MAG TPA: MATE family efflux transporter [Ferruginibacter sp.]|nr:MATE family efflux transporter [Ferruginibacter sp.]
MAAAVSSIPNLKVELSNRQILNIALPITVSMLIPQLNMLTNSVFLGHLSTEALGNAGITAVFYLVFAVAGNGLTNALQSVFSRYAGQDMSDFFKTIFSQGLRLALIFAVLAILFTWLIAPYIMQNVADARAYPIEMDFLRIRILGLPFLYVFQLCNAFMVASLNSRYLLIGFGIEAIVNIVLDYVLIFGKAGFPAMGFNGAAWASVISEIVAMATAILVLYFTRLKQTYNLFHNLKFDALINKEVLKVSAPLVLQYFISLTTWLVFFLLIEKHGEMAKAISNTMRNIFGITGMFVWSFAATSNNMVSNLIGQKKQNLVLPAVVRIMCWSLGVCIVISVLLNIFPYTFFSLFGQGAGFVKEGIPVIRVVTLDMIFMSIAGVWLNSVTGTGKTRVNLAIEVAAIFFYIIFTWYFMHVNYVSLAVAWLNEMVYWTVVFVLAFIYMKRGAWKHTKA